MNDIKDLVEEVKEHVHHVLKTSAFQNNFCYHNLHHLKTVVHGVKEIGEAERIGEEDLTLLEIAAWFHDVGLYTQGKYEGHEEQGVLEASAFLVEKGLTNDESEKIYACIRATKMPQAPTSELERIMCDADLIHLSKDDFFDSSECLRREFEFQHRNIETEPGQWLKRNIQFLLDHHYFTAYGKNVLEPKKKINLERVLEKIYMENDKMGEGEADEPANSTQLSSSVNDTSESGSSSATSPDVADSDLSWSEVQTKMGSSEGEASESEKSSSKLPEGGLSDKEALKEQLYKEFKRKEKKKAKKKHKEEALVVADKEEESDVDDEDDDLQPEGLEEEGISQKLLKSMESIYRTTSRNHLDLSKMADNKAHIMIQVNAIIVSLVVSLFLRRIDSYTNLLIPIGIMLVSCLVTIIFSVLATRPNITRGTFTEKDLIEGRSNLLFFGNFYKMSLKDYDWGMKEVIKSPDLLYSSIVEDIYFLGKVLGRKYRLIRIAYTVFLYGFVVAVLSFIAAIFISSFHH